MSACLVAAPCVLAAAPGPAAQSYGVQYAADRAEIEDLQARYMFALDWQDADAYAAAFTEDGVLDWAYSMVRGRETIRAPLPQDAPHRHDAAPRRPNLDKEVVLL